MTVSVCDRWVLRGCRYNNGLYRDPHLGSRTILKTICYAPGLGVFLHWSGFGNAHHMDGLYTVWFSFGVRDGT